MHLLDAAARVVVEREKRLLRPAMAFGQERHHEEYGRRGGGEGDADLGVSAFAETPFQGGTDIVEAGKMGRPFRARRQGRPVGSVLLEPSPK